MAVTYYLERTNNRWVPDKARGLTDWRLLDYGNGDAYIKLYPEEYQVIEKVDFKGHIRILDSYRGRSASGAYILVEGHPCGEDFIANMSSANLVDLITHEAIEQGEVTAMFTLAKKGSNYFVQYIGSAK
ncbi:hypothetical protein EFV12PHI1_4 [Enterococcus phage EfV12-phi1]|uniref:Uncharacterized protein n=2 Tax=Schiekvirus TaxID=2732968 RepID=A0AAE9HEJ8_9CAUD|nr:hypothetical protein HOU42_gp029 [Enterococcus phage EfV12-phi1]AYJ73392.1 hypothetical protein EFV12PHI1_4 [Enterococcus phage EfV12-phi1]UPW35263.1 hypothetical protein KEBGJNKE_00024 [Enterococcus phage vB_OCPT_Bop]